LQQQQQPRESEKYAAVPRAVAVAAARQQQHSYDSRGNKSLPSKRIYGLFID